MEKHDMATAALVLTSTADEASASRLARTLVEEGLAACVTRSAVRSTYRWEEATAAAPVAPADMAVCDEDEVLLVVKTAGHLVERLEKRLLELHPYACPEFVVVEASHVEPRFLAWLTAACA